MAERNEKSRKKEVPSQQGLYTLLFLFFFVSFGYQTSKVPSSGLAAGIGK
jgi:hypothetical protein